MTGQSLIEKLEALSPHKGQGLVDLERVIAIVREHEEKPVNKIAAGLRDAIEGKGHSTRYIVTDGDVQEQLSHDDYEPVYEISGYRLIGPDGKRKPFMSRGEFRALARTAAARRETYGISDAEALTDAKKREAVSAREITRTIAQSQTSTDLDLLDHWNRKKLLDCAGDATRALLMKFEIRRRG